MDYFHKIEQNPYSDLSWNIPDQKQGEISVFGGNSQNFNFEIRTAEALANQNPIRSVQVFLPDTLKNKLPPLDNFRFLPSTDSGSFRQSDELNEAFNLADFNLLTGDFSKNSITTQAIISACIKTQKPTLITRDSIDLITSANPEQVLMNNNIYFFATLPGVQKLFRSVYYPKVILLSQPLLQIVEALHKFTLSYPISIITFCNGQILIAKNGNVSAINIENTKYTPLSLWMGTCANKIATYNLFNPNNFEQATIAALFD